MSREFIGKPNTKLDVYLVSGQSNASGSTRIDNAAEGERDRNVYENVRYYHHRVNTNGEIVNLDTGFEPVKEGQGHSKEAIGPELGMASVLNPYYDREDRFALILKHAAGGTSLLKHEDGEGHRLNFLPVSSIERYEMRGSWYPESLYLPKFREQVQNNPSHPAGFLTRLFKKRIREVYARLLELGFLPENIRFVSLNWMQGEDDRKFPEDYPKVFPAFAREIRKTVSQVTGKDYSRLPVVLDEISETFSSALPENVEVNRKFIAAQNTLPELLNDLYLLKTHEYKLTELRDGVSVPVGTDQYHWSYRDAYAIGRAFGEKSYEFAAKDPV